MTLTLTLSERTGAQGDRGEEAGLPARQAQHATPFPPMRLGPFPPMQVIEAETRAQQAERSMHAAQSELESRRGSIPAATAKMERSDAAATERGVALAAAEREAARAVQGMEAAEARERTLTLTLTLALAQVQGMEAAEARELRTSQRAEV